MKEYKFKINGKEYDVTVNGIEGRNADVTVNGVRYSVEMSETAAPSQEPAPVSAAPVTAPEAAAAPAAAPAAAAVNEPSAGAGKTISSPLPGVIIEVSVKEGQTVKRGQKVAVLEAMKMENEIQSPVDGTVTAIHVSKGDSILEGDKVASIA